MWQSNLINSLIVIIILLGLFVIGYCRMKNTTLTELFMEIKEIMGDGIDE